jgi:hypothetical protein
VMTLEGDRGAGAWLRRRTADGGMLVQVDMDAAMFDLDRRQ